MHAKLMSVPPCRVVRRFTGHKDRVTDMVFSEDARWLITSAMDGHVRVWDVPNARCLQVAILGAPGERTMHVMLPCRPHATRVTCIVFPPTLLPQQPFLHPPQCRPRLCTPFRPSHADSCPQSRPSP